jgi:hypothetical protein
MDKEEAVSGKELDEGLDATLRETLKGINERGDGIEDKPAPDKPSSKPSPWPPLLRPRKSAPAPLMASS